MTDYRRRYPCLLVPRPLWARENPAEGERKRRHRKLRRAIGRGRGDREKFRRNRSRSGGNENEEGGSILGIKLIIGLMSESFLLTSFWGLQCLLEMFAMNSVIVRLSRLIWRWSVITVMGIC